MPSRKLRSIWSLSNKNRKYKSFDTSLCDGIVPESGNLMTWFNPIMLVLHSLTFHAAPHMSKYVSASRYKINLRQTVKIYGFFPTVQNHIYSCEFENKIYFVGRCRISSIRSIYRIGMESLSFSSSPNSSDFEIEPSITEEDSSGKAICNIQPFCLVWNQPRKKYYNIHISATSSIDAGKGWLPVCFSNPGMFCAWSTTISCVSNSSIASKMQNFSLSITKCVNYSHRECDCCLCFNLLSLKKYG